MTTALPLIAAVTMGYGHLRAASALADHLGVGVAEVDREPWATPGEARWWRRARTAYELASRAAAAPGLAPVAGPWLDRATALAPVDDGASSPCASVRLLDALLARGFGGRLTERLAAGNRPMLTTFYAPALAAARRGDVPVACVVTDSDIHRIWAPAEPAASRILYLTPTRRAAARLESFGVPRERVVRTGFPLPPALLGGPELEVARVNLARRIVRLDPAGVFIRSARAELERALGLPLPKSDGTPPRVVFAVGGAGAQWRMVADLLRAATDLIREGRLRLALVAGTHRRLAARFSSLAVAILGSAATAVEILHAPDVPSYLRRFDSVLADADVLVTKPSELSFYAALGLPLILTEPLGDHERANRAMIEAVGAGSALGGQGWAPLRAGLADGSLARAAVAGYSRLPRRGLFRIAEAFFTTL